MSKFHAQDFISGCSTYIREYVRSAGKDGVVVGLSYGIDSTLAATLAVMGLGKKNVVGLIMPIKHQNARGNEITDSEATIGALNVASWLDIRTMEAELTNAHLELTDEIFFGHEDVVADGEISQLCYANISARLRMVALMAAGETLNYLNLGTGNKSELMVGYITKYGDGGVDFEPLGDIYKTEVYQVARAIEGFPGEVLNRAPSAGLWPGQTDEGEIGMSYGELDQILQLMCEAKYEDAAAKFGQEKVDRVIDLMNRSYHKRNMPPTFSAASYREV